MAKNERVQWVCAATSATDLKDRYDEWAKHYDQELERDFEWVGPQHGTAALRQHLSKNSRVLDAGAGTGLVGQILHDAGFRNLVAMDLSQGMLTEARKKDVYMEYHQMEMGKALSFTSNSFDATISVGVLTVGHAPASSLEELVRVTRPGGYIVFTLRPDMYAGGGFKEQQGVLESDGKWKLVETGEKFQPLPKGEPEVYHQVWVYQVIA